MPPQTSQYSIPGVVTEGDVEKTRTKHERIQGAQQKAIARQSEISQRMLANRRRIRVNEWLMRFRKFGDDWMTRTGFLFPLVLVGSIVLSPLSVVPIAAILALVPGRALSSIISVIVFSSIPVALTVALRRALFVPDDDRLLSQVSQMHSELHALSSEQVTLEEALKRVTLDLESADASYRQTLLAFQSRINRLRSTDWRVLQAIPFENFLAEIFLEWGYEVEKTQASWDQGVDLIISKGGIRIAIQAKGYLDSTVGNDAVQQAHTGMTIYRCQRCAVITNSTFTPSARQAAAAVGCVLIDGESVPLLIEGQLRI